MAARTLLFSQAENEALRQEMRRDTAVILLGEDVAGGAGRAHLGIVDAWGGPMGTTKGLIQEFGPTRVYDTPICEMSFLGAAVGAAMTGLRPVVDFAFANLVGTSLDALMNQAAFMRYMLGGTVSVPLVLRSVIGTSALGQANGGGPGAQHSEVLYSLFAHIPGLKTVAPSDAYTAKGLLAAAIRDPDPVVYCSHRRLLGTKGEVPEESYVLPIGQARTVREGGDVTLVGIARTVAVCLEAATALASRGVEAEVVDLLSLYPLDEAHVADSVRRTRRLVVVDEDHPHCSIASEVAARLQAAAFGHLDAPIKLVTGHHTPLPYTAPLESAYVPSAERVEAAVWEVLGRCRSVS
jgi:acetoin:2,6-dichlorophenolindophenol oxidoreductase subunit beta